MATFEIGVHVTNQLYNKHGFTPRDKAAEYIEGAFDQTSRHDVNIVKNYYRIYAPIEESQESFYAYDPCTDENIPYNNLSNWWLDELDCDVDSADKGSDVNLLLTDSTGQLGRCANDYAAVSEGGPPH